MLSGRASRLRRPQLSQRYSPDSVLPWNLVVGVHCPPGSTREKSFPRIHHSRIGFFRPGRIRCSWLTGGKVYRQLGPPVDVSRGLVPYLAGNSASQSATGQVIFLKMNATVASRHAGLVGCVGKGCP